MTPLPTRCRCADLLKDAGARSGVRKDYPKSESSWRAQHAKVSDLALFAAAEDNLDELIRLQRDETDFGMADFDYRTALHLAASNGCVRSLYYILAHGGERLQTWLGARDRRGNTPLHDAIREEHGEAARVLQERMKTVPCGR